MHGVRGMQITVLISCLYIVVFIYNCEGEYWSTNMHPRAVIAIVPELCLQSSQAAEI